MSERRRIGFLIDRWEPERGGAERALAGLARHLEERGHEVLAFALSGARDAPGELHRVKAGPRLGGLRRAGFERDLGPALVEAARAAECDVTIGVRHLPEVDVYWPHGGSHLDSWLARHLAAGRTPPREPSGRHRVFLDFERRLLSEGGARRVVCVSELVRRELAERHPACANRLVVVPNGADLEAFHPGNRESVGRALRVELGVADGTPLLVFVARDPLLKGLPTLYDALSGMRDRPWTLLVAGARHPRRWGREATDRGLTRDRVVLRDDLPAPALFAAADLTVHPTWRDTSGLVLLESLASGTPVITTRFAGASVYVTTPDAGTVIPIPGQVELLRAAVTEWFERLRGEPLERDAIRASVEDLALRSWLDALERIVAGAGR